MIFLLIGIVVRISTEHIFSYLFFAIMTLSSETEACLQLGLAADV